MTPVDQLVLDSGKGDCLRACVATVLSVTPEGIPNFAECGFFDGLDAWLKSRGLRAIRLSFASSTEGERTKPLSQVWIDHFNDTVILWGDSPRFREDNPTQRRQHAVVGVTNGYGFQIVHDPHPSRDGLHGLPYGVMWIVPTTQPQGERTDTERLDWLARYSHLKITTYTLAGFHRKCIEGDGTALNAHGDSLRDAIDAAIRASQDEGVNPVAQKSERPGRQVMGKTTPGRTHAT